MCVENGQIKLDKAKAFVQGYQGVEELQAAEKDSLQLFVEYAAIATFLLALLEIQYSRAYA